MQMLIFLLAFLPFGNALTAQNMVDLALKLIKKQVKSTLAEVERSQCIEDVESVVDSAINFELWAAQMLDATSKFPAGFLTGNFIEMGSYDGCMEVEQGDIKGKFCLGFLSPSREYKEKMKYLTNSGTLLLFENSPSGVGAKSDRIKIVKIVQSLFGPTPEELFSNNKVKNVAKFAEYYGVPYTRRNISDLIDHHPLFTSFCVPSSCKQDDLQVIADAFEKKLQLKIHYTFSDEFCGSREPEAFTVRAIFALLYFFFVCLILIAATIYDLRTKEEIKGRRGYILAFSLYTNYNELFGASERNQNLETLDAMKALSMAWIISAHMALHDSILPVTNTMEAFEMAANPKYAFFTGGFLGVDTFLTISGFLIVFLFLQSEKKTPIFQFYTQKFIKFFPALVSMLIFYTSLFEYLAEGPMWFFVKQDLIKPCLRNWLSTLFFMQNYWNTLEQCPIHTWYFAIFAQLTLLTPLIFIFNKRYNKKFLFIIGILIIVTLNNFITTIVYNLGSVPLEYGSNYNNHYYYLTHTRASPWLIGSIFGCILHKTIKIKVILSQKTVLIGWLLSLSSIWFIIQSHTIIYNLEYSVYTAALFNAFARPLWASSICWIIFACNKGYGGIVTHILSGYIYQILSRVTYSMYLLHFPILQFYYYQRHLPPAIRPLKSAMDFCGYYIMTLFFSIFWTLAFVSPITALQNFENRNNRKCAAESGVIITTVTKIQ